MTLGPMPVTVVVCAYTLDRWSDIVDAVDALAHQSLTPERVLLIVDHNDLLEERARRELTPVHAGLEVLSNKMARGLSGARNTAIDVCRTPIVAFLDDDARPARDWLELLVEPFQSDDVFVTGGFSEPDWPSRAPRWFPETFNWVVGSTYVGMPTIQSEVRNVHGASMAFRTEVFTSVGGFEEGVGRIGVLPLGCEETELCIRLKQSRPEAKIVFVPSSRVLHRVSLNRTEPRYFVRRCFAEGISKAQISELVGASDGTQDERRYTQEVLPAAFFGGFRSMLQGDLWGLTRSLAIASGLLITAVGFAVGSVRARRAVKSPVADEAEPPATCDDRIEATAGVWCPEVELGSMTMTHQVPPTSGEGSVRALVRLRGVTVGYVHVTAAPREVTAELIAEAAEHSELRGRLEQLRAQRPVEESDEVSSRFVSVAVCTRDRSVILRKCLESLRGIQYQNMELLIVDNAATDASTRELVAEFAREDPRFRYVTEPEPGLSNARNRALAEARGEILVYTDDDVTVDRGWIANIVSAFEASDKVACVTGLVCSASLTTRAELFFDARTASWSTRCEPRTYDLAEHALEDALYPFSAGIFGTGANFAFDRVVLQELGGFDEALGAGSLTKGGEDLDAFVQILLAGYQIRYEPSAIVWHYHRADDGELVSQMYGYGTGLTAYLTKLMLSSQTRWRVLGRVPVGLRRMVAISSTTNDKLARIEPPAGALRRERLGYVAGPVLYLRAARKARARHRVSGGAPSCQ